MSALVMSQTGIRPMCGKAYFVRLAIQSWACRASWSSTTRQPAPALGRSRRGLRLARVEPRIFVDPMDNVWIGGNGGDDSHALKFSHAGEFLLQIT